MTRLVFGPCDDPVFFDRFLKSPVDAGRWSVFSATCPSWEAARAPLEGGPPEALVVWPGYTSVPAWVWSAPVPVVAAAHDPNLLWSGYRHTLPLADLVLTDAPSAERMRRAGLAHARAANLFGLDRHFAAEIDTPEAERDIDLVFVGNVNPHVQSARMPWLGRLAALADRFRVVIATRVYGVQYRALLRRAKLAFNRSIRGECNLRALEAAASGAVLLQEAENQEVPEYLRPTVEYAPYTKDDFEAVVARLLANAAERTAVAEAAKDRARGLTFDALVQVALGAGGTGWGEVKDRARTRVPRTVPLAGRVWQRVSTIGPDADPALVTDLTATGDRHALGVLARPHAEAEPHLAAAAATGNRLSMVGRAVALAGSGRHDEARAELDRALGALEAAPELTATEADGVPYPARFDWVRAEWERTGFDHPDDPPAARRAKARLLLGRARALRAELTGAIADHEAAVACCPEHPHLRVALGAALARADRFEEAAEHLRCAVEGNPLDALGARAWVGALVAAGLFDEAERARAARRVLATAAPALVTELEPVLDASEPIANPITTTAPPDSTRPGRPAGPHARVVELTPEAFAARFGTPDTTAALGAFTPPRDVHVVLALLTHTRPRRVLEIGTATGQMTANLTHFTPPDALVYSVGVGAEEVPSAKPEGFHPLLGTPHQDHEVPPRPRFAMFLNHFGTAHKALVITADSRTYDFTRLGPLDFVFVDGGHDFATARSDSLGAYRTLRPGGVLVWRDVPGTTPGIEVERAIASLAFPEPLYTVTGTQVAFLFKGEGLWAVARADSGRVAVAWEGEFDRLHSLAHVNRAVCTELVARGHDVVLIRPHTSMVGATSCPVPAELASRTGAEVPGAVHVRHRWPPEFTPPTGPGPLVLMQPWEYGRLPRAWVEPILDTVDEVWAYSRSVLRAYVASGVPEDRVALVPPGVDPDRFRPGLEPLPLPTQKRVKLLFVGGTIPRKGFDVLLNAYCRAFTRDDDVCLVVKDMGIGNFYRDQTAGPAVRALQADPTAPEVVYLTDDLPDEALPRLYAACGALVHPYRGEGFGLPVLEAMACGLPVVVTAGGPSDEFVPQSACWRIPARLRYFEREAAGEMPTVGRPWWLEPDLGALVAVLKEIVASADERQRRGEVPSTRSKGIAARRAALGWTWARTAAAVEDRIRVLRTRTPVRFRHRTPAPIPAPVPPAPYEPPAPLRAEPLSAPGAFARAVTLRADEPRVVTAAPESPCATAPAVVGKPRVSLTMIVRNEERHLPDCLASVRDLVDEAVVIDTGSTDRTREIARSFGCVVGEFPWVDHFAAARNAALEKATGDYAFWMDADDRLDQANRVKLKALFGALPAGNAAYVMKCLCVGEGTGGTVVDHVRLFRLHPAHRWTYRVHEQILPALRATGAEVSWSEVCVRHVGYVDPPVRRRKLDRDLRLLLLDEADEPGDPFTLFNLGSVYHELGDVRSAAAALDKSLAGSHPKDSIVRKAYALLARCRHQAGDRRAAEAVCRQGRAHYPDDAELLFLAAGYAREGGDYGAAEELYRALIGGREGPHFASVDTSLRAVKGRHNLAVVLLDQNRLSEAEGLWRAALAHDPHFLPAQVGLGEVYVKANNGAGLDRQIAALEAAGETGAAEAAVLAARWNSARGDYPGAVAVLEIAVRRWPRSLGVRVALSHAHIAADSPPDVLEPAFRGVLELDPHNAQARGNLEVLYRKTGRWLEGVRDPNAPAEGPEPTEAPSAPGGPHGV
jgi:glycosyltransferase involved in cell wall biosynthesis/tetratricopeptide (TPR) repeat protein/predicted O-methyltransferase YrrM